MNPPEFLIAKLSFGVAALVLAARFGWWFAVELPSGTTRIHAALFAFFIFGAIGSLWVASFSWLGEREASINGSVSQYSNERIRDSAFAISRRIRQLQQEANSEQSRIMSSFSTRLANPPEGEKEAAAHREDVMAWMHQKQTDLKNMTDSRFGPLKAEARNIIFHMMNRIPPPQPMASEMVSICLSTGPCAGPDPYGNVADYIDQLASLVPIKR